VSHRILFGVLFGLLLSANYGFGQFSPGELSAPHQHLSGISNCTNCHVLGKGEKAVDSKCLDCHQLISTRIDAKEGYHARVKEACVSCHSEHNGVKFQLIHWENGKENFKHEQTGYLLIGKHKDLTCEKCHNLTKVTDPDVLEWEEQHAAESREQTYLGLPTNCLGCHEDYHQEQLGERCENCHSEDSWKPASKFDHAQTDYPLVGKHEQVKCEECHKSAVIIPGTKATIRYTGIESEQCSSCHDDVHKGSLGTNCTKCHTPFAWNKILSNEFNHDLTDYPLRGEHRTVKCESCHLPGEPLKPLPHQKCVDCHRDYHEGQFAHRSTGINCEPCHSVQGFVPAKFTVQDHKQTDFPLTGAHEAQPCIICHEKDASGTEVFHWEPLRCATCHEDIHKGQFAEQLSGNDCDVCHQLTSWQDLKFSHEDTDFPLRGKHKQVKCEKCHTPEDPNNPDSPVNYVHVKTNCASCHNDIHQGQFAEDSSDETTCAKCHTPDAWKKLIFHHNTMSRFSLKGKHSNVACAKCHPQETLADGSTFVRYKPLGIECKDCHSFTEMQND